MKTITYNQAVSLLANLKRKLADPRNTEQEKQEIRDTIASVRDYVQQVFGVKIF